ncbi:MAG TPA: GDP-L-fucose synthase [Acetobacteraceae bacterium]|jgi:GDP-L-fucose synthase
MAEHEMMRPDSRIVVTGGTGMVGSALVRVLRDAGFHNVRAIGSADCDLLDWQATRAFFAEHRPDHVFHIAARVFGLMGHLQNKGIAYLDNILINTHTIEAARLAGVRKIVAMGSGCVYPHPAPGAPVTEDMVWYGPPHHAEDSYAHAKRAMLAQLVAYKEQYGLPYAFVISGNMYGPDDKFVEEFGQVTPSLVRKFHVARMHGGEVPVWGTGTARRDFMFSEDAGRAMLAIMQGVEGAVNMGSGEVHAIRELVDALSDLTGMGDRVVWDSSKPDGQDHRASDLSRLFATGFRPQVSLAEGLRRTYEAFAAKG